MNGIVSKLVGRWVINKLHKFDFIRIEDKEELNKVYNLRYQVYCEELGFLDKNKYINQLETDEYDSHSVTFGAYHNKELIGALRLIGQSPHGVPTSKFVDLKPFIPEGAKFGEVSRFVVNRKYRKSLVSVGLMRELVKFSLSNNFDYLIITNSIIHEKRYNKLGFYRVSKPYVYPLVQDKYLAVTMINNIKASQIALPKTQPIFHYLLNKK